MRRALGPQPLISFRPCFTTFRPHPLCIMAEEPPQKFSSNRLGEYTVVGEIAEGTFGKVKSKPSPAFPQVLRASQHAAQWPSTP